MPDVATMGRNTRTPSRILTSIKLQAIEYVHLRILLLIVLALPVGFFALTYYATPASAPPVALLVPDQGGEYQVTVPQAIGYSQGLGIMGVGWALATVAFFSVMGNLRRDRRLVLSGYASWQILVARLAILAVISAPLAFVALVPASVVMPATHPAVVLLANFTAGLIAAAFGMLIGTLLPRATEGVLIIVIAIGVGMSLPQEASAYFFLNPALQMLIAGRLADSPVVLPYVWQAVLVIALFLAPSLGLWWWRTRVFRHGPLAVGEMVDRSR